jgi:predicted transcriptional regulator YheO
MSQDNEKKVLFENLKHIADSLVKMYGRNMEVVVHDFEDLKHSLMYISGNLTKRKVGAPVTDLVVKAWRNEGDQVEDIIGYRSTTKEGRILKSSTIFIRDGKRRVVGALCTNYDVTDLLGVTYELETLTFTSPNKQVGKSETFASTVTETIDALIEQSVAEIGKQPPSMSIDEKVEIIGLLETKGTFLIKGAIDYIATRMGVSKYTIYNYLQKFRANQNASIV